MSNGLIRGVAAVKKYIELQVTECKWHKASVLVSTNGKVFGSKKLVVFVELYGDATEIIVEDLHTVYGDCINRFTQKNSSFCLIGKTLQISSTSVFNCPITIELTRE